MGNNDCVDVCSADDLLGDASGSFDSSPGVVGFSVEDGDRCSLDSVFVCLSPVAISEELCVRNSSVTSPLSCMKGSTELSGTFLETRV